MIFKAGTPGRGDAVIALREALPELVMRLDSDSVDEVERRLSTLQVKSETFAREFVEPHVFIEEQLELWAKLTQCLEAFHGQWQARREQFAVFSTKYFNQPTGRARRGVMLQYLREHATSGREFRRDRRALDDHLDFDVLRERHKREISHTIGHIRVVLYAMARLGADLLARLERDEDAALAAVQCLRSVEPSGRFGAYFDGGDRPDLLLQVLLALHPMMSLLLRHNPAQVRADWMRRLVILANVGEEASWVQIAALRILVHDPQSGVEIVESRFAKQLDGPDDWHVRAHCARLLGEHGPARALEALAEGDDSSQEVAMAIAEALGEMASTRAVDLLEGLAMVRTEPRAKVRGAALLAVARQIEWGGEIASAAAGVLLRALQSEPEAWVVGCLHEELESLLDRLADSDPEAASQAAEMIRGALAKRLQAEPDTAVANRIARLRLHLAERMGESTGGDVEHLVGQLARLHAGQTVKLPAREWSKELMMRAMARAAGQGFGLYARRRFGKWQVRRGERTRMRLWRVLHELRNPAPNKRQGFHHTHGRIYPGWLRAHPEQLGELTPTAVPGERRQISAEGGWGPYLPLVDDVLDAQLSLQPVSLVTTIGVITLEAPRNPLRRLWNFLAISWRYDRLDRQRAASIEGDDERQRAGYLASIEQTYRMEIGFERHLEDDPVPPRTRALFAESAARPMLEAAPAQGVLAGDDSAGERVPETASETVQEDRMAPLVAAFASSWGALDHVAGWLDRTVVRMLVREGARIADLAIALFLVAALFLGRLTVARWRIDRWRASIPLSIGGWGTRGKSGTERLKAGLFHGLGYDVFVKTTGCEAMFIHAPRGDEAREIFIYRPYDKATIWEQRDMLALGTKLNCDVFLWECMALSPRYVDLLQSQWMRDDLVTLTNAYPDHEDIQGPAGVDVARTIAGFLPDGGQALTTEREMLPILRDEARKKQTELQVVGEREEYLLSDDVLERFPYNEHPRNIALVAAMAERLGLDPEYAVFQMADHVVPDLGVLKVYPEVELLGRKLSFIAGNSANERAGFMNNWTRMGLDKVDPAVEMNRRVITVINNRYDRISRSKVFADIIVRDIAADRHVLIGTNLSGLRNYLADSLANHLDGVSVFPDDASQADPQTVRSRLETIFKKLRLLPFEPEALVESLRLMVESCGVTLPEREAERCQKMLAEVLDESRHSFETLASFRAQLGADPRWKTGIEAIRALVDAELTSALAVYTGEGVGKASGLTRKLAYAPSEDIEPAWLEVVSCAAAAANLQAQAELVAKQKLEPEAFRKHLVALYEERFWDLVVSIDDPDVSGDYIVRKVSQVVAPGSVVSIMGAQNIKGTGLDFVYRWVELNATVQQLDALERASASAIVDELRWIEGRDDFALLDALVSWRRLGELDVNLRQSAIIDQVRSHLATLIERKWASLDRHTGAGADDSRWIRVIQFIERMLEPIDAMRRRWKAEHYQRLLVDQRISHTRMAILMQKLVKRQKGGWLVEKFKNRSG